MISRVQNFSQRTAFTADTGDPKKVETKVSTPTFSMGSGQSQSKEKESGMMDYFVADLLAIIVACGIVDAYFHGKANTTGKKFSQLILKKNHNEEVNSIGKLTKNLINQLSSKDSKAAEKLQKVFESRFNTKLPSLKEGDVFSGENISADLINKTEDLFVKLNDSNAYDTIGSPFIKEINKHRSLV